ncbi:MAG TPA: TatD family hydrolase [Alphaproteobacteria bacterium]|nr:TatD family hydrolase [Alphaproteobacteria bacterium]
MLVDSHCHLDYPDFAEEGVAEIVGRARSAGVRQMLTICTQIANFDRIRAVADAFPYIHCTVGTHPHHAAEEAEVALTAADIVALAKLPKVAGLGETGLDYYYDHAPRDVQKRVFENHIAAGIETDLPLVIHTRDAEQDTIDILRGAGQGKSRGVMHCFSGTQWLAEQALDIGFYISFSGIITFKKSEDLREVVKRTPLDRILVETDSPYLAPVPNRGKRNEPAFVVHTARMVADLKGISYEDVVRHTGENFLRLFDRARVADN